MSDLPLSPPGESSIENPPLPEPLPNPPMHRPIPNPHVAVASQVGSLGPGRATH